MIDVAFLTRMALFADLDPASLERVGDCLHERHLRKGQIIFHQGDPGETVYFVREGRVKVYRVEPDGRMGIVRFFEAGEPFALVVAVDRQPYPATAEAVLPSRIWGLRVQDFQGLCRHLPHLTSRALELIAGRLRAAQESAHSLKIRDVHSRLARFLLEEARQKGQQDDGFWTVSLNLTREDLAGLLGTARETVSRAMADLRNAGALEDQADGKLRLCEARLAGWLGD